MPGSRNTTGRIEASRSRRASRETAQVPCAHQSLRQDVSWAAYFELADRSVYALTRYTFPGYVGRMAIRSFASRKVERFYCDGQLPKGVGWSSVAKIAERKLDMLDYARILSDLSSPPGNRLEALKGHLAGFHSVRINDQWRVVFRWTDPGPVDVDIIDYH